MKDAYIALAKSGVGFSGGGGRHLLTATETPATGVLGASEGKNTPRANKPAEAPQRGKRGKGEKAIFLAVALAALLTLAGCGGGPEPTTTDGPADYEAKKTIEQRLEETPIPKGYYVLLKDESYGDNFTVLCTDGEATVSVVASANFTIPYVADMYLEAAQEAAEEAGVTLARFDVNSYAQTSDGIADESWASWQTKDGKTGTLTDDTEGETIVKPGLTLEQVYEYYADYEELVGSLVAEAGGSLE